MILFEDALEAVKTAVYTKETERIDFMDSMNRVLAEDIRSDIAMPPFDKSAVDGYACRKEDINDVLEIIEVIPAGKAPEKVVGKGQCSKIMTGAPLPEGADTVIMVEDTEEAGGNKIKYLKDNVKDNVCYLGEDIKKGDIVLQSGTLIQPRHIAVLASAGGVNPLVYKQVKVAVISTGDELVEPEVVPSVSQIRNSNAYQLLAQASKMGAIVKYIGIALDTEESTREMLTKAFDGNDVILLTGGVSMGDFDHVPKVLKELGVELIFKSIAVQPGRPTVFGVRKKQFIFGLPGNPVSSFVQFELLVKPLIFGLTGYKYLPLPVKMPMGKEYSRRKSKRLSWLPVKIEDGKVFPLEYHGSAHINALTGADGLISIAIGETKLEEGKLVEVRLI